MGLLAEIAGCSYDDWETVGQIAGLDDDQVCKVILMDDGLVVRRRFFRFMLKRVGSKPFAEIADVVEGWFRQPNPIRSES
jgi:hypothetical protein